MKELTDALHGAVRRYREQIELRVNSEASGDSKEVQNLCVDAEMNALFDLNKLIGMAGGLSVLHITDTESDMQDER